MAVYLGKNKVDMIGGQPVVNDGIDTSDATVTASDLAQGVIAYGANGKVTGDVRTVEGTWELSSPTPSYRNSSSGKHIVFTKEIAGNTLVRKDSSIESRVSASSFGDATVADVAEGKTFTSANGLKLTGELEGYNSMYVHADSKRYGGYIDPTTGEEDLSDIGIFYKYTFPKKIIAKDNFEIELMVDANEFGNARSEDVAAGVTFTSENGLKITGTGSLSGGGIDTSDATATSSDIAYGKTAYVNGQKVTGNVTVQSTNLSVSNGTVTTAGSNGNVSNIGIRYTYNQDTLIRKGVYISRFAESSEFGNATASDVAAGKTFTSSAGLKVTGTATLGSGTSLPEGAIAIQMAKGVETSTQVASGYSASITYGDNVIISDDIALAFDGTTNTLSSISDTTNFSVLEGKYIRSGSSMSSSSIYYYIPSGATFTVGGSTYNKTVTCDKAQKVSLQKVEV